MKILLHGLFLTEKGLAPNFRLNNLKKFSPATLLNEINAHATFIVMNTGRYVLFALAVFFSPVVLLFAQSTFGGILVVGSEPGEEWLDTFESEDERDDFASFFSQVLPDDVRLFWGNELLETGTTYHVAEGESSLFVLTWETLPEPKFGCGDEYDNTCEEGLAVDVYKRTGDTFLSAWCGTYVASGEWGYVSRGCSYTSSDSQAYAFTEEGEYYIYIHRPEDIQVSKKESETQFAIHPVFLKKALASYAQSFERTAVGGIHMQITFGEEGEPQLSLPIEGRYAGERGVVSTGPNPEKGYADSEVFTFKVVYTNPAGTEPEEVMTEVGAMILQMVPDTLAVDPLLRDGDVTNGEQYIATTTLENGFYTYGFSSTLEGETIALYEREDQTLFTCSAGYSSIAFFPGLQASRLFTEGIFFENKLWEPNRDADVQYLELNDDGTPKNSDIYTKTGPDGVVDEALGITTNIYKSLLNDLDDWKNEEHIIVDYEVLPYDWRFMYETILESGVVADDGTLWYGPGHATDTPYIYEKLKALTETSASGRIFLIGHSMGGLILKKILADMEDDENHPYRYLLGAVDNVALVASPQLGTPKAVASLLHGAEQEMDIPIIHYPNFVTEETARVLGNGLPSVYTLLPSRMYFDRVKDVNPEGEEGSYTELIINGDCPTVSTYEGMLACFDASDSNTQKDDLVTPLQPRSEYVEYADALHERLDSWVPPDMDDDGIPDFTVTQIAGWGVSTISAIEYKEKTRIVACPPELTGTCTETYMDPQPRYTMDGDRTVVVPSAVSMQVEGEGDAGIETLYVDIFNYNESFLSRPRKHSDILEIDSLRTILKNIAQNKNALFENPDYVHSNYSDLEYANPYMRLALHSPVDIEVESNESRVGKRELPDGGIVFDAEIPNSYYDTLGEGKYVGFPLNGEEHSINLTGTATGTFTFEINLENDGVITESKKFTDVSVTASTKATIGVSNFEDITTLSLDINGDGIIDEEVYPDGTDRVVTYDDLIDALEELAVPYKKGLVQRAKLAKRFDERGQERIATVLLHSIEKTVKLLSSQRISKNWRIPDEERDKILEIIRTLKEGYES